MLADQDALSPRRHAAAPFMPPLMPSDLGALLMTSDLDISRTANVLVKHYGEAAAIEAAQSAEAMIEKGRRLRASRSVVPPISTFALPSSGMTASDPSLRPPAHQRRRDHQVVMRTHTLEGAVPSLRDPPLEGLQFPLEGFCLSQPLGHLERS